MSVKRGAHACAVAHGRLWCIGGYDANAFIAAGEGRRAAWRGPGGIRCQHAVLRGHAAVGVEGAWWSSLGCEVQVSAAGPAAHPLLAA